MRRRTSAAIGAAVALTSLLALLAPAPVSAQTGYPPAACNVLTGAQTLGDVTVGQRFSFQLAPTCPWTPGAAVTVQVNGVLIPGKVANANGFVEVTINVLSQTLLEVNPQVPGRCGTNTVTGTGPSAVAGNRQVTQTASFNLVCDGVAKPAAPVRGRLSLTGANITRWAASALVLLLIGTVLVAADRRRASSRT